MKAYVLHGIKDLRFENVNQPKIKSGEVLISVKAVGICGSDIPRIYETGAHKHPLIPGHEFSGIVADTADDVSKHWINKRVGIFPLIPCHECFSCKKHRYEMCRNYSYLGSRRDGAFAEYVAVPAENLIELPENVSFEEAAMLEPMAVAVHAIRRCSSDSSDSIAICGLGTIGIFVAMFLKNMGFKNILLIGKKDIQKKTVVKLGFDESVFCDIRFQDPLKVIQNLTDSRGIDVFFECVGRNSTINQAIQVTAPSGRVIMVGNPASEIIIDKNVYWKILRNQLQIYGTWNSSFLHNSKDDWNYVLEQIKLGLINPSVVISHKIPFSKLNDGLRIMRDKIEDYVKVMVVPD